MHHNWSTKELVSYYETQLEKGIIREGGAAYKRMLEFKDKLEEKLKKKPFRLESKAKSKKS